MPELPDVEIYKKEASKILHKKIEHIEITDKEFVKTTEKKLNQALKGQKIEALKRQGKHLFLISKNHHLLALHFGMTGYLSVRNEKEDSPEYAKCVLKLDDDQNLYYVSKRKLGSVEMITDIDSYLQEHEIGPDALNVGKDYFIKQMEKSKTMIKNFLTDQSVLSGIGNVYADEILFQAKIHPKQQANKINEADGKKLFEMTVKVLKMAIDKDADASRLPNTYLLRKRKEGENCPRCNGSIDKIKVSGRATYYCPNCQKKK